MASIQPLTRSCGSPVPPGTKAKLYLTLKDWLASWPDTEEDGGGSDQGDSKTIAEAFDFTGAGAGKGYWMGYDILVDTGAVVSNLEGEIGGQGFVNRVNFFILGVAAAQLEFADLVLGNAGCLIAAIEPKGQTFAHIVGDLDNPCFVEAIEGGTGTAPGDRVGMQYTLYSNSGITPLIYPLTLGLDTTPEQV